MTDIVSLTNGQDLGVLNTQTPRAANILAVQIGSLEFAPSLGIDLKFFLSEQFEFQNEAFKAYLIQVLANQGINVSSVAEAVSNLFTTMTFNLTPDNSGNGLVR